MGAKLQSNYLQSISNEITLMATAIKDAAEGRERLPALSGEQREQLVKMARRISTYSVDLEEMAEDVASREASAARR